MRLFPTNSITTLILASIIFHLDYYKSLQTCLPDSFLLPPLPSAPMRICTQQDRYHPVKAKIKVCYHPLLKSGFPSQLIKMEGACFVLKSLHDLPLGLL